MRSRVRGGAVSAALAAACALAAGAAAAPAALAADACPNAAIRAAQQADLPDCRAYEMVSPVDKAGFSVTTVNGSNYGNGGHPFGTQVLLGGDGFSYVGGGAVGDPEGQDGIGIPYRALRGPGGWSSIPVKAPFGPPAPVLVSGTFNPVMSADGARSLVLTPAVLDDGAWPCLETQFMCMSGSLYVQDNATRERRLIAGLAHDGSEPSDGPAVAAATADLRHVLLTSTAALTPDAVPGVTNLFAWTDDGSARGVLRLVGRAPDGTVLPDGAVAGQGPSAATYVTTRALSADGRRILFTSAGQLYLREDGARTVQVSASQRSAPDPAGPGNAVYWTAESEHGASVFFSSGEQLTDDSAATPSDPDLYRYDVASGALTDLTAGAAPAGVLGVLGASRNASVVYFAATAQLVPGEGTAGDANVYRWEADGTPGGALGFVATLGTRSEMVQWDTANWATGPYEATAQTLPPVQISDDGRFLAFVAKRALTGQDTAGTVQVFRYDAAGDEVVCVSCAPDGSASTGDSGFRQADRADAYRVVSERGDVAFQTEQALLPADRNGARDVYLYGSGGLRLISTGADPDLSTLAGLSASGRDVFFATRAQLVAEDADDLSDLYDARIDGGFAPVAVPAPCEGDACQGRPAPGQGLADPATRTFSGPGNVPAPPPARTTKAKKVQARALAARGTRARIRVQAPAAGRITISGSGLRTTRRTVTKAQAVTVTVRLTAKAARRLARNHRVRVTAKVRFTPAKGTATSTSVATTIKEQR